MDTEEQERKSYQKGYNAGYFISQYETELFHQLEKTDVQSPYFNGLKAGKTASIKYQFKENSKLPDWLRGDPLKENIQDITKDKSRDKDYGIEPDL